MKRPKVETSNLHLSWGTYKSFSVQILGVIGRAIQVSESKNEMPILGLNSSSSKINGTRGIKLSNLEASGHALSAVKNKPWRFRHFFFLSFFLSLFIYSFSKSHGGHNYSKTTKARILKFGQIINLYMKLCTSNFGGATSRGLEHMPPNLWQRSLLSDFSHTEARNLKFGQMISVFMNLRPSNFGGATSRSFGHTHYAPLWRRPKNQLFKTSS